MKKLLLSVLLAALTLAAPVFADHHDGHSAAPAVMDEKMAKAMALSQPGEFHRKLDPLVGKFKVKTTMWMKDGATPTLSEGTSEAKWILDGRFVEQKFKGEFMGKPFEGLAITGYDTVAKEYNSVWLDSIGTGIMKSKAKFDDATRTMKEEGRFSCPMNGKTDNKYEAVTTFIDEDHYRYEMWNEDDNTGKKFKSMEINYSRS